MHVVRGTLGALGLNGSASPQDETMRATSADSVVSCSAFLQTFLQNVTALLNSTRFSLSHSAARTAADIVMTFARRLKAHASRS